MNRANEMPLPEPAALERSALLRAAIGAEMRAAGGSISFAHFMELALYAPQLGYYTAHARQLGAGGDFTTAPETSPLFARALARQVAGLFEAVPRRLTEFGAGSGALMSELLAALEVQGALPEAVDLVELSAPLAALQRETLERRVPHLLARCHWPVALPERLEGVVIGNEVLDAMPVELVVRGADRWLRRQVTQQAATGEFSWRDGTVDVVLARLIDAAIPASDERPVGYLTEVSGHVEAFIASVAQRLSDGVAIFLDYGFPRAEYYHPERSRGTLMAHYRHRAHADLLAWPGLQDLTCHVDFSAVARAASAQGCSVLGYTSQARFLINCGIVSLLEADSADAARWLPEVNALQRLVSEAEMGELFKAIAFGRGAGAELEPIGFAGGDRRARL
jgi:SAM-dependent MidA family methyltransferase